jgi:hypothetical protein
VTAIVNLALLDASVNRAHLVLALEGGREGREREREREKERERERF